MSSTCATSGICRRACKRSPRDRPVARRTASSTCWRLVPKKRPDLELTLIGHSMGTIVLNRALRECPRLRVRDVVYMAAACSIDDFRSSLVPYLTRTHDTRFYNLMLHPAAEVREWQMMAVDLPPRGSLLAWIDNFLAAPETTLDRTLGSWENAMQTAYVVPAAVRPRITLKGFGVGGRGVDADDARLVHAARGGVSAARVLGVTEAPRSFRRGREGLTAVSDSRAASRIRSPVLRWRSTASPSRSSFQRSEPWRISSFPAGWSRSRS